MACPTGCEYRISYTLPPDDTKQDAVWWGEFVVPPNQQGRWQLGALTAWVQHLSNEWRVAWRLGEDNADHAAQVLAPGRLEPLAEELNLRRFCFAHQCNNVHTAPALPDRPVVTKPDKPLYVFPGEQATLYLSFPLWLRIEIGDPPRLLQELPSFRLSDTWFGPNTREGELCYASRTLGRLHLSELARRAHRAVTAVIIRNRAADSLYVERLNVNLPMLSLYRDTGGMLWTNALTLERLEGQGMASLEIERRPPPEAKGAAFVSGPRQTDQRNLLVRAFSSFLS